MIIKAYSVYDLREKINSLLNLGIYKYEVKVVSEPPRPGTITAGFGQWEIKLDKEIL